MENSILELTDEAASKINEFMSRGSNPGAAVRITLVPEAPVAEKYQLEFVESTSVAAQDVVSVVNGLTFVFDERSAGLIRGTKMDFVEGMWSSGFRFESPDRLRLMADPLAREVDEAIRSVVNPAVAAHSGHVELVDVRDAEVFLEFSGGCKGCGLAPVTVREVVEKIVRSAVPAIRRVVDVTDHSAGESPYTGDQPL